MLICEALTVMMAVPSGMIEGWDKRRELGCTAAAIVDLADKGRLRIGRGPDPVIDVINADPVGEPAMDPVLTQMQALASRPMSVVLRKLRSPEQDTVRELQNRGVLGNGRARLLGLIPARYPLLEGSVDRAIRIRLRHALAGGSCSPQDAALLVILDGVGVARRVLKTEAAGQPPAALHDLIRQIGAFSPFGEALHHSVKRIGSAMPAMGAGA